MVIKVLALILILVGVIFAYDARILSTQWFGFEDQNEATARIENSWLYFCDNWRNNILYCYNS